MSKKLLRIFIIYINNIVVIFNSLPLFHFTRSNDSADAHEEAKGASRCDRHDGNKWKLFILKSKYGSSKSSKGRSNETSYKEPIEKLPSHWCSLSKHPFLFPLPSCQWSIFFLFFFLFLNYRSKSCESSQCICTHLKIPWISTFYNIIFFNCIFIFHYRSAVYSCFALVLLHFFYFI